MRWFEYAGFVVVGFQLLMLLELWLVRGRTFDYILSFMDGNANFNKSTFMRAREIRLYPLGDIYFIMLLHSRWRFRCARELRRVTRDGWWVCAKAATDEWMRLGCDDAACPVETAIDMIVRRL